VQYINHDAATANGRLKLTAVTRLKAVNTITRR